MSRTHSTHWGAFRGTLTADGLRVVPRAGDPDPSALLDNVPSAVDHPARVRRPAVRRGWWEDGAGPDDRRGRDSYVEVEWDAVLDRLAAELGRYRPEQVYGGSYGWASAGRFHHAQSQVHRFLNHAVGGYVRSVGDYSGAAAQTVLAHVLGPSEQVSKGTVTWDQVAAHTDTVLAFGGMNLKNSAVGGGISAHVERGALAAAAARGALLVNVGPLRSDLPEGSRWLSVPPGSDTALMFGLLHTLVQEDLHDRGFLDRYCVGWDTLAAHLRGRDAEWAAEITGVPAAEIRQLARRAAAGRTLVTVAQSLQRAEFGEQPVWAGLALAAALGQIGLPGGGFCYGLGSIGHYGRSRVSVPVAAVPQGHNGCDEAIPVARIADMLLHPGEPYPFNGEQRHYPQVRLAYWAGGNPFHHHQDLGRLRRAFARLDTFVVHEPAWTATARHADVVLPTTWTIEREDLGAAPFDPVLTAMHRLVDPPGEARDDYTIFSDLAARLGVGEAFTEGRDARGWLEWLYEPTRAALDGPPFAEFWAAGEWALPQTPDTGGVIGAFRADPDAHPLPTPSGRIELWSATIDAFGYPDAPGDPTWLPPTEAPDERHPLWLVANQPATRLHSQLDFGAHSRAHKVRGREVARLHPADAGPRGIATGDLVRLSNDRGACLAAAEVTDGVRAGVVQLPTGAWFDPLDPGADVPFCVHGNPNVLTRDRGTSPLAQGCTGQHTTVALERWDAPVREVRAFAPPVG
ncbi:molybdopterin-dependent oxidoreductase [Pseudonocardia sp. WMMC193]|uniref:molybdopterin-dependent oxidoreductase n=1 Tax=Pseudonocardia sp. WMMC193 TaxID=2911965 RepID=UPI001F17001F|nr:molybdopterin-dependent oxidoreductase [Pseudonocardia sp. WMMC193]MCF7547971.1 molybdopterin-dependent oxidoreductase [Pseudonocardia sp. WMMC193]